MNFAKKECKEQIQEKPKETSGRFWYNRSQLLQAYREGRFRVMILYERDDLFYGNIMDDDNAPLEQDNSLFAHDMWGNRAGLWSLPFFCATAAADPTTAEIVWVAARVDAAVWA